MGMGVRRSIARLLIDSSSPPADGDIVVWDEGRKALTTGPTVVGQRGMMYRVGAQSLDSAVPAIIDMNGDAKADFDADPSNQPDDVDNELWEVDLADNALVAVFNGIAQFEVYTRWATNA